MLRLLRSLLPALALLLAASLPAEGLHFGIISATHDAAKKLRAKVDEAKALETLPEILTSYPRDHRWSLDGPVHAMLKSGDYLYLGGGFTSLLPETGGGASASTITGRTLPGWHKVEGAVHVAVPDAAGGWYIGGVFSKAGGGSREQLAHLLADGSLDTAFNAQVSGDMVNALILSGADLYVGGKFTGIGGLSRVNLAKLDAATGQGRAGFSANTNDSINTKVDALILSGADLYVGGLFADIGLVSVGGVAKADASTGAVDPNFGAALNGEVRCMALSGNELYIGGDFNNIDGLPRSFLAKLEADDADLDLAFDADANALVYAMALSPAAQALYVAGDFTQVSGTARNYLARLDTATGAAIGGFDPSPDNRVVALTLSNGGTQLYVGGDFSQLGGQGPYALRISAADGSVDTGFSPDPVALPLSINFVRAISLALDGSKVYLGGKFSAAGAISRPFLAKLDLASGTLVESFSPLPDNQVLSLAMSSTAGALYAGGSFAAMGPLGRSRIAKLDPVSGTADAGFNPGATGGDVRALALSGNDLYLGGLFTDVASSGRAYLAKLNAGTGAVDLAFNATADDQVRTLLLSGSSLYAGGIFGSIGGASHAGIVKLAAATGVADPAFTGVADDQVRALLLWGGALYAAGDFGNIGGGAHSGIAKLSPGSGVADAGFNANANSDVFALAASSSRLYAGGTFDTINGSSQEQLARLDPATGTLDSGFAPGSFLNNSVNSLLLHSGDLFVGGFFESLGSEARNNFGVINP